ncbi:MAG: hypothetical protein Q4A85_06295 [Kingella sp. (in: b-proteobacteria)]|nr:hypothetical protein [Kingella sp. (in: b-proteobacteria)]
MGYRLQRGAGMIGSLKMQNRLVLRQTVFCWMDWVSGCFWGVTSVRQPENAKQFGVVPNNFLLDRLGFRLPNPSHPFSAAALSPTSSRAEHPFFGKKRALVRRRA